MSKYVKHLITEHLRNRLQGVSDALLVNVVGLEANADNRLRKELQAKNIHLMAVKNSLAARAVAGTPLAPLFDGVDGPSAICWGAEDIVSLAKEITRLVKSGQYATFQPRGGVMDGAKLTAAQVAQVSTWPSRQEQLGKLMGLILTPGARLAAQLIGPGARLAGQVAQKAKGETESAEEASGL